MTDQGHGVFHLDAPPLAGQTQTEGAAEAAGAAVVEIGHGKAALGPELDARVEYGIAGRGWSAVQEHHQRRLLAGRVPHTRRCAAGRRRHGRSRPRRWRSGATRGATVRPRPAAARRQRGCAARPNRGRWPARRAGGRGAGDAVEKRGVRGQLAKARKLGGQAPLATAAVALDQQPPAVLQAAEQQAAVRQRQVADGAQLPGGRGVVGSGHGPRIAPTIGVGGGQDCAVAHPTLDLNRRVDGHPVENRASVFHGVPVRRGWAPVPTPLHPRLPPAATVAQAGQPVIGSEGRLLQGFVADGTGEDLDGAERTIGNDGRPAQPRGGPRQFGAVPLDPCQPAAVAAQPRRAIEVSALGQHPPGTIGQRQADQSVQHRLALATFLHRQHGLPGRGEVQITVAAVGIRAQGAQRAGQAVGADSQPVDLLVRLVDQRHTVAHHAEGAAAVFVDPAAHGQPRRGQALGNALAPQPQAAARLGRVEGQPQQSAETGAQLGEVAAGRGGPLGRPGARPVAAGKRQRHGP